MFSFLLYILVQRKNIHFTATFKIKRYYTILRGACNKTKRSIYGSEKKGVLERYRLRISPTISRWRYCDSPVIGVAFQSTFRNTPQDFSSTFLEYFLASVQIAFLNKPCVVGIDVKFGFNLKKSSEHIIAVCMY